MVKNIVQGVLLTVVFFIHSISITFAAPPTNFTSAKKIAFELFEPRKITLYCACAYDNQKRVDLTSCSMQPATHIPRANRMEWEHMMPAEQFGREHQCWKERICTNKKTGAKYKGRKCCEAIDAEFRKKEAELYNLWPAVGAVNAARSNYQFGILDNKTGYYGCEFSLDEVLKIAEPPDRAKGIVARANLFMADKYQVPLSAEQRNLLLQWSAQFPPSDWELQWASSVALIEGYPNPYINPRVPT